LLTAAAFVLVSSTARTQGLTGALIGTVKDGGGGVLQGAVVRVTSPALIGGPATQPTDDRGQFRFPALPPGAYVLEVSFQGFTPAHEDDVRIAVGATIERTFALQPAGYTLSLVVEGTGWLEARDSGFSTRFGPETLPSIPVRRSSMFDSIRAAPGVSPTSPSSGSVFSISAFGSGTNENQFLFDGTNFTCPCSGQARSEPGIDFIQEVQIQSVGASAEYGNMQGAVINVVTRQGSDRFLSDASYYGQPPGLTSQPEQLVVPGPSRLSSGYERVKYQDLTTNIGGPAVRDRLWFFSGYQHLRDYDSQPGTDPAFPRTYKQDKIFAKLNWRLAPGLQLQQSFHQEIWVNPVPPTFVMPFETTNRTNAHVPAITFGNLTHTLSPNTVWDVRVGRFLFDQDNPPSVWDGTTASRLNNRTNVTSGAPPQIGPLTISRTTVKATISHYQRSFLGADHQWKGGAQVERGWHHAIGIIPTGTRFVDDIGDARVSQATSRAPSQEGGAMSSLSAFASDAITIGDRLTINAGVRFDHSRAISQDLPVLDASGNETDATIEGLGTLYTWNIVSPRLGVTLKLTGDGRTILRGSYGRFSQGVLTGEIGSFHPGVTVTKVTQFDPATGGYTLPISEVDPRTNLLLDAHTRAPRTDEYSLGVDRQIGRGLAVALAYVRKDGANFIGWTDVAGQYREETRLLPDGRSLPVFALDTTATPASARRFLLTNQDNYALTYNGLVMVVEKRRSRGWQAFGSYTLSKAAGLQAASAATAGGAQVSSVVPPGSVNFGRDPNDLTNAYGRLPNDRPHMFRAMGSIDVPRTGLVVAANLQYFTGKPWAATTTVVLPQGSQRILLESRGSRRLSSQTLLDLRVSKTIRFGGVGRVELLVDVLNALNEAAEESLASDNQFGSSSTFGQGSLFVDPRRVMFGARLNLGR